MAFIQCLKCGAKLPYASKDHPCKGGVSVDKMQEARKQAPRLEKGSTPLPSTNSKRPAHKIIEGLKEAVAVARGEIDPARVTVVRRGRPKITEPRPWETDGISKRTYYRRQAKAAKGEEM